MTDNSQNFNGLQERNEQTLNNISQLQTQEKQLYDSLDDASLSSSEKQKIIQRINEISQMRIDMYASMKDMYSYYNQSAKTSENLLNQSMNAINVIEDELNQDKQRMNLLEAQKYNKLRLVQINTYYGKRYNAHSKLMKTIVLMCIPLIILAVLANKGILPPNLYVVMSGIVLVIGLLMIGLQIMDISRRSNMNWDEYNWYFNQSSYEKDEEDGEEEDGEEEESDPWEEEVKTCVGAECCNENSTYDEDSNMCISKSTYNKENVELTESFRGLENYAYAQVKPTYINNNVAPLGASLSNFK